MGKALNILIGIVVFIIAAYFVLCVVFAAIHGYRIMTGKISKEEQERLLEMYKREKERDRQKRLNKKKNRGGGGGIWESLSYPSPLNRWGLWH